MDVEDIWEEGICCDMERTPIWVSVGGIYTKTKEVVVEKKKKVEPKVEGAFYPLGGTKANTV